MTSCRDFPPFGPITSRSRLKNSEQWLRSTKPCCLMMIGGLYKIHCDWDLNLYHHSGWYVDIFCHHLRISSSVGKVTHGSPMSGDSLAGSQLCRGRHRGAPTNILWGPLGAEITPRRMAFDTYNPENAWKCLAQLPRFVPCWRILGLDFLWGLLLLRKSSCLLPKSH